MWNFLTTKGDDLFVFAALVAVVLQGDPAIQPSVLHWVIDCGVICSLGHKVFFPSSTLTIPTGAK